METNPLPSFLQMIIGGAARHVLTGLGGMLVLHGAIQNDQTSQFVSIASGIVVWFAGWAWSCAQKNTVVKTVNGE